MNNIKIFSGLRMIAIPYIHRQSLALFLTLSPNYIPSNIAFPINFNPQHKDLTQPIERKLEFKWPVPPWDFIEVQINATFHFPLYWHYVKDEPLSKNIHSSEASALTHNWNACLRGCQDAYQHTYNHMKRYLYYPPIKFLSFSKSLPIPPKVYTL